MARKNLLLYFNDVVKEIDSYIMEDTLRKYPGFIPGSIKTKAYRKERTYDFLMYIFENDGLVLELRNALRNRGFHHFVENLFTDIKETSKGNHI